MLVFEREHARADAQTQLGHASRPREKREPGRNTGGAKGSRVDHVVEKVQASALHAACWRKEQLRQPERKLRGGGSSAGLRAGAEPEVS